MKKVAIIGMGVAGISVLRAMEKHVEYQDYQIDLYNPLETFGTGLPYQKDSEQLLINQTADTMSLELEDSMDFVKWVKTVKNIANGEKKFFPRKWYGEYTQGKLTSAMQRLQPTVIKEEVSVLRIQTDGSYLVQTALSAEQYDSVHLCIGHLPYQDPYHLKAEARYIHHPYPVQEKLDCLPEKARIGIIGTGLTSIDLMRFLKHQQKDFQLYFFSRKSHFSLYRGFEPPIELRYLTMENVEKEKSQHNGFVPLTKLVEWFILECQDKEVDFKDLRKRFGAGTKEQLNTQLQEETNLGMLQAIIHQLDPYLGDLMHSLTEKDKQLFYKKYEPLFKHFRTPMPKISLEELMQEWNESRIQVWEDMHTVETLEKGFKVQCGHDHSIEVDYLVNATGHDMNVESASSQSILLKQLLNERILQPEPFGGVQVIWPSAQAVSQRQGVLSRLYVHGQLIQGVQYGNNAHLLMRQAEQVVSGDVDRQYNRKNNKVLPTSK